MKKTIGLVFGGQSAEHEISLMSAKNIYAAIDRQQYTIVLLYISKQGERYLTEAIEDVQQGNNLTPVFSPQLGGKVYKKGETTPCASIDVFFPVLHGPNGEDGTIQGLFELIRVPYVGCGVCSSSICMDKEITKRLLEYAGIPIVPYRVIHRSETAPSFKQIQKLLGSTVFVKPANMGSSIGVSKVVDRNSYQAALDAAFVYDEKVLIEKAITGREVECSVLDGTFPIASKVGEIQLKGGFYDYETKYSDDDHHQHELVIPASLPDHIEHAIQDLSLKSFHTLNCSGLARVDFFLDPSGNLYLNEVNTMPGFTVHSMYPKLLKVSGFSYTDIIQRLIDKAIGELK